MSRRNNRKSRVGRDIRGSIVKPRGNRCPTEEDSCCRVPPPTFPSSYIFIGENIGETIRYTVSRMCGVSSQRCFVDVTKAKLERTLNILAWRDYSNMARMMKLHEFVRIVDIIGGKSESK